MKLFTLELNNTQKAHLALKFRTYGRRTFTEQELNWMQAEIEALVERVKNNTEHVYIVGERGNRIPDLFHLDLKFALKQIKSERDLSVGLYNVNEWLLHRLIRVSDDKLKSLEQAQSYADLVAFFQDVKWTGKLSKQGEFIEFSNNGYTPTIRVAVGQTLKPEELRSIYESVRAGREFSSQRAKLLRVRYIETSYYLDILADAGFSVKNDARDASLKMVTYVHKVTKGKITVHSVRMGDTVQKYTDADREGFLNAALYGVDYIQPFVKDRLVYREKPTPEELQSLGAVIHMGQLRDILENMGWILSVEEGKPETYTHPIFKNYILVPVRNIGAAWPSISTEKRAEVIKAIETHQNVSAF